MDERQAWSHICGICLVLTMQGDVDKWKNSEVRIPRAKWTKGYSNFVEGCVHELECKSELSHLLSIL